MQRYSESNVKLKRSGRISISYITWEKTTETTIILLQTFCLFQMLLLEKLKMKKIHKKNVDNCGI